MMSGEVSKGLSISASCIERMYGIPLIVAAVQRYEPTPFSIVLWHEFGLVLSTSHI